MLTPTLHLQFNQEALRVRVDATALRRGSLRSLLQEALRC